MTEMQPERRARLVALGELHRRWARAALTSATFDPGARPAGSDYGQHFADIDATADAEDAFHREARTIMGLDPDTGATSE